MKTLHLKNNLKRVVSLFLFTAIIAIGGNAANPQEATNQEVCRHLTTVIQNGVTGSKVSPNLAILFVAAKDQKNAFEQAQEVVIKLNATLLEKKGNTTIYSLPNGNGNIQIKEENDDCTFILLSLPDCCKEHFQMQEIRYIRIKCYNDL
jgi:hypothetical protein